jgi:type I restriction enzyme, S subunit
MPPRRTTADTLSIGVAKCLRLACQRHFPRTTIGAVAEVVSGGTPDTANASLWDGDVVWVTPKDLGRPRHVEVDDSERHLAPGAIPGRRLLPVGTVLLSSRAPIGHLGIAARPLCTNQGFKNIICSATLHNRYLFHLLRASIDELEAEGRGNTFKEIPSRVVSSFEIPLPPVTLQRAVAGFLDVFYLRLAGQPQGLPLLPPPLEEQRRIVARIEELATRIDEAHALRRRAADETELLSQSGNERRYQELCARHGTRSLANVCSSITDGDHNTPVFTDEGVRFIFVGNVSSGHLHFDGSKRVSLEYFRTLKPQRLPKRGDILYSAVGATLGIPAVVDSDEPFCFQRHVAILKPDETRLEARFGWHMLRSRTVFEKAWSSTTGSAQPTVPLRAIRELQIPAPPLTEQRRIVSELDALQARVDAMRHLQADATAELDALLPSVLDKAFKGEL